MNLNKIEEELKEIEAFLAKPDAYNAPDFAAKNKRATILREILELNKNITVKKGSFVMCLLIVERTLKCCLGLP